MDKEQTFRKSSTLIHRHLAIVGPILAGDHPDERRLAGAIRPTSPSFSPFWMPIDASIFHCLRMVAALRGCPVEDLGSLFVQCYSCELLCRKKIGQATERIAANFEADGFAIDTVHSRLKRDYC